MLERWLKNIIILTPVFFLIGYSSLRLYRDYRPDTDQQNVEVNRELVGEIVVAENTVKRQFDSDIVWSDASQKTQVYNKDSIRTGDQSTAIIKLTDNSILEVGENSLIVLDKSSQNLKINFKAGDISTKNASQNLAIQVKGSVVKGTGADLKLKTGPGQQTSVQVSKGKAFLTDKDNKTREIDLTEQAGIDEAGQSEVTKIAVVLRSPEDKTKLLSNSPDTSQTFNWDVQQPSLKTEQLEISRTPFFKPESTKIFKGHQAIFAPINQGISYWRVGWLDSNQKLRYTESRQISIQPDKRLELLFPELESSYQMNPDENQIDFQWKSLIDAKAFVLEVSLSRDFKSIVYTKPVKEQKHLVKNLSTGTYFWRVKAFGQKNEELTQSPIGSFILKVRLPALPELIRPVKNAVWETETPIELVWRHNEKAKDYRVAISKNEDMREIVKSTNLTASQYTWKWDSQGVYYWNVKAIGANGNIIGQSETRRIDIRVLEKGNAFLIINPKNNSDVVRPMVENPEPVLFQWQILRATPTQPVIHVGIDREFRQFTTFEPKGKISFGVPIKKSGKYFWRLVSFPPGQANNQSKWEKSETAEFNLKLSNSYLPPKIIAPADKEKIETEAKIPVKFEWEPVKGADQYHIVVERVDTIGGVDKKAVMLDRVQKETSVVSGELTEGKYVWYLFTLDEHGQEGVPSRPYTFEIIPPILLDAPRLNAPVIK